MAQKDAFFAPAWVQNAEIVSAPACFIVTAQLASVPPVLTTSSTIRMCCPCVMHKRYTNVANTKRLFAAGGCVARSNWRDKCLLTLAYLWVTVLHYNLPLVSNPRLAAKDSRYPLPDPSAAHTFAQQNHPCRITRQLICNSIPPNPRQAGQASVSINRHSSSPYRELLAESLLSALVRKRHRSNLRVALCHCLPYLHPPGSHMHPAGSGA